MRQLQSLALPVRGFNWWAYMESSGLHTTELNGPFENFPIMSYIEINAKELWWPTLRPDPQQYARH